MKVYVTQGHEQGIGLEVFFKSCLMLSQLHLKYIELLAYKKTVCATLESMKLPYQLLEDSLLVAGVNIKARWLMDKNVSESFTALKLGMELSERGGVLYTLPTSKDQFPGFPGHTEFFRSHYQKADLGMFFSAEGLKVLLLSDHAPINKLSEMMTEELIYSRLKTALFTLQQWSWPTKRILVSGLNPHAGEKGLIGHEDERITKAIKRLTSELKIDISGPYPGDTMLFEQRSPDDVLVYIFHDQGLGVFKGLRGFIGSNITLGLPYPRFSPDHGTSFGLYGKNIADYRGCKFSLNEAIKLLKKVSHGKNSGNQS